MKYFLSVINVTSSKHFLFKVLFFPPLLLKTHFSLEIQFSSEKRCVKNADIFYKVLKLLYCIDLYLSSTIYNKIDLCLCTANISAEWELSTIFM